MEYLQDELLTGFALPFYFLSCSLLLTPKVLNLDCVELCIFYFVAYILCQGCYNFYIVTTNFVTLVS